MPGTPCIIDRPRFYFEPSPVLDWTFDLGSMGRSATHSGYTTEKEREGEKVERKKVEHCMQQQHTQPPCIISLPISTRQGMGILSLSQLHPRLGLRVGKYLKE